MNAEKELKRLRQAYQEVFGSPQGELVLSDLHNFCGADMDSFDIDPYITSNNEGKRRVWLHIKGKRDMTDEYILRITRREAINE